MTRTNLPLPAVTAILALALIAPLAGVPAVAAPAAETIAEPPITDADREHWAFQPLRRPALPAVPSGDWAANPVDRFVLAQLHREGLEPMPPASMATLARRVSFDLTGLPPGAAANSARPKQSPAAAYERLVDSLLASPGYAERAAQHWLDLARFAETDGFEFDSVRPQAWRYRDWVIEAIGADMPYDRFLTMQIAGDAIVPGDSAAKTATMFCLSGPDMPDINSQEERRQNLLDEMTGTVASVFLGLQLACAQCHDHKYDPISQADFYRLRAVFEPAVQVQKKESVESLKEPDGRPPISYLNIRGDWRRQGPEVQPAIPRIASASGDAIPPQDTETANSGRRQALARILTRPDHVLTARVIVNRIWQQHFGKGLVNTTSDFGRMGGRPTHPQLLDWLATELVRSNWSLKRLHRLIVSSATYRQASHPNEPTLGDHEHRMARQRWSAAKQHDPENRLLSRGPRRRLSGEEIRDAMLAASGSLSRQRGGPGVMPPLPAELRSTLLKNQWQVTERASEHDRRSIYIFARRNLRYPLFEVFDRPDANHSCPRRNRSTTARQSLWLLNSEFSLRSARRLAGYLLTQTGPSIQTGLSTQAGPDEIDAQVSLAYQRTLARPPTPAELATGRDFLAAQSRHLDNASRGPETLALPIPFPPGTNPHRAAALTDLCLALFNLNEFIYVD